MSRLKKISNYTYKIERAGKSDVKEGKRETKKHQIEIETSTSYKADRTQSSDAWTK